jgi:hypothetical protein
MEQKPTKQRNIKLATTKSEPATDKMVLKAESVLEVKSKKQEIPQKTETVVPTNVKGAKSAVSTTATPTPTATATATPTTVVAKSKKTVAPVQNAGAQKVQAVQPVQPVQPVQAVQAVQPSKGKKVTAESKTLATPIPVAVASTSVKKATKDSKKSEVAAVPVVVQEAGTKAKATKGVKATKVSLAKVQKVKAEEALEEPSKSLDDKLRYFKLYYNDNICGRYSGKKPKQAANKAFSSIIKDMKKTDNKEGVNIDITFTIKECTRNSFHKEYKYVGKRLLLKSPVKVTIENGDGTSKDIVYKYHNELKKAPKI